MRRGHLATYPPDPLLTVHVSMIMWTSVVGPAKRRIQPIGSRHVLRIKTVIVPRVQIVTNPTTNYLIWWGPPKTNIVRPTTLKTKLIAIFLQSSPYTLSYLNSGHNGFVCVPIALFVSPFPLLL